MDTQYTEEQLTKVMEAQKLDRIRAIHLVKRLGVDKALAYTKPAPSTKAIANSHREKPAAKPKAEPKPKAVKVAKPKAEPKERESKYSKKAIIAAWERGNRVSEIVLLETPGIKGVSNPYVGRVLFGSKNSGGVSPEQAKRVAEEKKRREKRTEENAAK